MAVDKLVDSSQLDSDLTSIANAIRTKGGTSAQLAFPAGFIDAIDAIETGGVTDIVQMAVDGQNYTGHVVSSYSFRARGVGSHALQASIRPFDIPKHILPCAKRI